MNYYQLFQLTREPFANSPDPDLFFYSIQHHDCLQKLELALRLRRGLSVVIGAVGTGKSTMCRALLKTLGDSGGSVSAHLILDPDFSSAQEFLSTIISTFAITESCSSEWQMKEAIKNYLVNQGVDRDIIPVLIIDEGQKLPGFCIELLREFLNFETNQNKLLEIVIFAQEEFTETLKSRPNFSDRITSYHTLGPLGFRETRQLIRYRISQCRPGLADGPELFPLPSLLLIYLLTGGYPRRIIMLCSKVLLAMLVKEKAAATPGLVWSSAAETSIGRYRTLRRIVLAVSIPVFLVCGLLLLTYSGVFKEDTAVSPPQQAAPPLAQTPGTQPEPAFTAGAVPAVQPESITQQGDGAALAAPDELGYLTVLPGMSLGRMITRIYGRFSEERLRLVLKSNPYLDDPARLKVDTKIFFPRLPDSETSSFTPVLVSLGAFTSLQEAYDFLISTLDTDEEMRILPIWNRESNLSFLVVLDEIFPQQEQARQAMERLSNRFRQAAVVVSELDGVPL